MTETQILIHGGTPLVGTIPAMGAKNSALKLLAATLLAPGRSVLRNVPDVVDIHTMCNVLSAMGVGTDWDEGTVTLDVPEELEPVADYSLTSKMRASIQVLGPLLARTGRARVAMPGGCNLGARKLDMHLQALEEMGATFDNDHGDLVAEAPSLVGRHVSLQFPSMGATENVLLAAMGASGVTTIDSAAREPEITDLCEVLSLMGAEIEGAGTPTITIRGVDVARPVEHSVVPDRIETGTYLVAGAITDGDVVVTESRPEHNTLLLSKLDAMGVDVDTGPDWVRARRDPAGLVAGDASTLPYPGFPTDLQPPLVAMLSVARGTSVVTENVFDGRFQYVNELNRMGARIRVDGRHAVIEGVLGLTGAPVQSPDIRAGAALVCAGLAAEGETLIVSGVNLIDRGYEHLVDKLAKLGATIERIES